MIDFSLFYLKQKKTFLFFTRVELFVRVLKFHVFLQYVYMYSALLELALFS